MSLNVALYGLAILELIVGIATFIVAEKHSKLRLFLGIIFGLILIPLAYYGAVALLGNNKQTVPTNPGLTPSSEVAQSPQGFPNITDQHWICTGESVVTNGTNVTIQRLGTCHISLVQGDVLVGTADRFQQDVNLPEYPQPPCTAFVIKGPIEMDLQIWWGGWDYRTNLDNSTIEQYLEVKRTECTDKHPDRQVRIVRLPE
jgi:hypothetical protein